jgi:hypothetical protein
MCSNIVNVSKHDGINLSKAEAMHPSTCPMKFQCNKLRIHKLRIFYGAYLVATILSHIEN